ncbi:unnamed protein product [Caenorhabditis auriculariae]|uniref:DRBM domain-containing protein n=1 Tax=Caenorhabditis auriculariae TaxID=2777116 RepID=A0A8S1H1Y9_9PELO|nr:unnamed protein product [Caenorhabditis auriculariae]
MPVYMHKFTRSVTLSRPYFLGEGSLRSHRIPLSAIPCLHRKRVDEQEAKKKEEREIAEATSTTDNPKLLQLQNIPTLTLQKQEDHSLSNDQVIEYCSSLFKFRKILVKKYKHVSEKFKARNQRKINAALARAGIKAPLEDVLSKGMDEEVARKRGLLMLAMPLAEGRFNKKMFLMNPVGKSSVMVLNEFAQRAMKARIEYVIDNTRNVSCPYRASATLIIRRAIRIEMSGSIREKLALLHEKQELSEAPTSSDDVKLFGVEPEEKFVLGYGQGASKKNARLAAAKDALKNLVPSVNINDDFMVEVNDKKDNGDTNGTNYEEQTMELFDTIKIDDNRVTDLCTKTGHPKPLALLKEAIAKSIKWNGLCLDRQNEQVGPQKTRVTLKLDKLEAQAEAVGGKAASQQAAQIMLQLMHPEFEHYGTLLRLYASVEEKSERKLARKQHDQVVRLQNKGSMLLPNMAVLGKLKEEMLKVGRGQTVRPPLAYSRPALEEGDSD